MKKRVLINGALGHMGRAILSAMESGDWDLAPAVGIDLAEGDFPGELFPSAEAVNVPFDVAVDFSRPQATMAVLSLCLREKKPLVTGTTGLSEAGPAGRREGHPRILCPEHVPGREPPAGPCEGRRPDPGGGL